MKKLILSAALFCSIASALNAQMGSWVMRDTFPAGGRSAATGYNVGTAAYVCCGIDSAGYKRSNWLYNPATDIWTQMQSLGGVSGAGLSRDVTMSFAIGNYAYVVGGQGSIPYFNDTWKYDAFNDTWTQVQNFGGGGRRSGVGFAINGKGYVALGQATSGLKNDCWEYDPATNIWTQKANFTGTARRLAVAFVINNIAYVGTGDDGICKGDFFAFDPSANSWSPKAALTGNPRYGAAGFAVNGKGYVAFGYDNTLMNRRDFWEYDPATNGWTAMWDFPGTARSNVVAVTCPNNKVYMGLGFDSLYRDDWYEFDPLIDGVNDFPIGDDQVNLYPNPVSSQATIDFAPGAPGYGGKVSITVIDMNGRLVYSEQTQATRVIIPRGDLRSGVYFVRIQTEKNGMLTKRMIVQ